MLPPGAVSWNNTAILQQVMCAAAKPGKGKQIAHIKLLQVDKPEDDSISGFEKPRRCWADLIDVFPVAGKNNVAPFRIFFVGSTYIMFEGSEGSIMSMD